MTLAEKKGWTCDGGMVVRREMTYAIDRYKVQLLLLPADQHEATVDR